jgi:hypothetical protein
MIEGGMKQEEFPFEFGGPNWKLSEFETTLTSLFNEEKKKFDANKEGDTTKDHDD